MHTSLVVYQAQPIPVFAEVIYLSRGSPSQGNPPPPTPSPRAASNSLFAHFYTWVWRGTMRQQRLDLSRLTFFFFFLRTDKAVDHQLSATASAKENDDSKTEQLSEPAEPEKKREDDEESKKVVTPSENGAPLQSPKRKPNGEMQHDVRRLHTNMHRTSECPSEGRKLQQDPLVLLMRAFPSQSRSVLELVLQGCGGNVVQALECMLQNQEKKQFSLPVRAPVINKSAMVHFCTKCGRKANSEDNFCAFCGQKLRK